MKLNILAHTRTREHFAATYWNDNKNLQQNLFCLHSYLFSGWMEKEPLFASQVIVCPCMPVCFGLLIYLQHLCLLVAQQIVCVCVCGSGQKYDTRENNGADFGFGLNDDFVVPRTHPLHNVTCDGAYT